METVSKVLQAKDKFFVCHFDGKQLEEFTMGVKATKERMTVAVSSPDMEHPQVWVVWPSVAKQVRIFLVVVLRREGEQEGVMICWVAILGRRGEDMLGGSFREATELN